MKLRPSSGETAPSQRHRKLGPSSWSRRPTSAGASPTGAVGTLLACVAAAWSLFQLWYASPLPFIVGFGIFNDTEARAIHLAFAVFLAFCAYPAFKRSSRSVCRWPTGCWRCVGAFCAAYLFLFYNELATRPGQPTTLDIVVGRGRRA